MSTNQNKVILLRVFLCCLLQAFASASPAQDWVTNEKVGNLEIFGEVRLSAATIQNHLQDLRAELRDNLGISGKGKAVQIIVFASRRNYQEYIRNQIPEAVSRRAIFYQNGDLYQIYTFRHQYLLTDLRHEYTHALLHQSLPFVPLWIDEGLAEYFEESPGQRNSSARLKAMKWKCRTGWKPSLSALEEIPNAAAMDSDDYRNSWAWIHYLIHDSAVSRTHLKGFLQAISAGEAPGRFSEWSTQRDVDVVNRVGSYFRRFRFSLR